MTTQNPDIFNSEDITPEEHKRMNRNKIMLIAFLVYAGLLSIFIILI